MVHLGIGLPQGTPQNGAASRVNAYAARAESAGFDSVWVQDQVVGSLPRLEPLAVLASVIHSTNRVLLGSGVVVLTGRSPIELARSAATLDHLSGGRLLLGIAAGSAGTATSVGVRPTDRLPRLAEGIELMRALWSGNPSTFDGCYWRLAAATLGLKPFLRPTIPLWLGGASPAALRLAALVGDGWLGAGSSSIVEFRTARSRLQEEAQKIGRPAPPTAKRQYLQVTDSMHTDDAVPKWFAAYYGDVRVAANATIGSASRCAEAVIEVIEAGAESVILSPVVDEEQQLERIGSDVLAEVRRAITR